ncbi:MAG: DUF1801 domain-containing protein [Bacteroidetes bacterium]|nr:DUF1801 domain-containing protein [Bacteroidota bacterium]
MRLPNCGLHYRRGANNIVSVNALKESANLSFFKGVLLSDPHGVLEQQGNVHSGRIMRFTNREDIQNIRDILKSCIQEAITIEESGMKGMLE